MNQATNQTVQNTVPLPTDPFFTLQWYLDSINVVDVWQDYTGAGVSVTVFDQGVDRLHPDLMNNYDSVNHWDAVTNTTLDTTKPLPGNHGTPVAGLIAADRNGIGTVGVAYDSTIVSISERLSGSLINGVDFPTRVANGFTHAAKFDVSNHSWGYGNKFFNSPNSAFLDNFKDPAFTGAATALKNAVATGRNGLGTIFVQSAGNSRREGYKKL